VDAAKKLLSSQSGMTGKLDRLEEQGLIQRLPDPEDRRVIRLEYGLGKYARQTARTSSTPDWLAALNTRGDALNKQYGLGDYAPER
jgi:hypothetical protein